MAGRCGQARLAELPALAIQHHLGAVHAVLPQGERPQPVPRPLHGRHHEAAHDVEPEAVHLFRRGARSCSFYGADALLPLIPAAFAT